MKDMIVSLILKGDGSRWNSVLQQSESRLKTFSGKARRSFETIKNAAMSLQGKLATLGFSVGAMMLIKQSAELDKGLTRIGQTAGETHIKIIGLRKEFFRMAKETGKTVEDLKLGFDNAVQSGLSFREAMPVTDAVNKGSAVTGAAPDVLTSGLTVAATAFDYDLAKPGQALLLLDKMTVAGRQGKAELENLSSIFARVGVNASRAGMGFDKTLGFIEGLSLLERNPERLATLADSTLRLFTNMNYLQRAQKSTGIKFFDDSGGRRDPLAVLADIKQKYDQLKTAEQKETFMSKAFQGADLDTIKGLQALLSGDMLIKISKMNSDISAATGSIDKDLKDGINNAIDQTGRLKAAMREAADDFIQPFNAGISRGIKKLLDAKKDGGLEMSGKEIAAAGFTALGIGYTGYKLAGPALKKFLGKLGNTGMGIAEGKAVEAATGVTPVFVTNWPAGGLGVTPAVGVPGAGKIPGAAKLAALAPVIGTVGAVIAATVATTTAVSSLVDALRGGSGDNWINKTVSGGEQLEVFKGKWGDMLYDFLHKAESPEVNNQINITIDKDGRATTTTNNSRNTDTKVNLNRGSFFSFAH